jgi:tRNA threonylcarbamoyl adenosine modification protein YeaZ
VLLLGLDTATPAVTVALHDGSQPLAQLVTVDAHRHAELLAPAIAKVIADAGALPRDLTGIVAGVGPGPYTGLRVGLVTARVLGAALGIPVYGLCSLDVIAADVVTSDVVSSGDAAASWPGGDFLVATDARRRELYWARYDHAGRRTVGPEVSLPASIPVAGLPAAGEGPVLYPEALPDGLSPAYPAAATLCRIAVAALAAGDPDKKLLPPEPLYLRRPDVREPVTPKRVTR